MAYLKTSISRNFLIGLPNAPAGKRVYYADTKEPGLLVCVSPTGLKSFQVYIKVNGRPVRVTLGHFSPSIADSVELPSGCAHNQFLANTPELNVRMARSLASLVKLDLKAGINPADTKRAKRQELTLGELFELYFTDHLKAHQKKRADDTRADFERYLGELPKVERKKQGQPRSKANGSVNWQRRYLSSITRKEILALHAELGRNTGRRTANKAVALIRTLYNKAIEWQLFDKTNPAASIPKYKERSRDRYLHEDELPRFFKSIAAEENANVRDYVLLSLLTGARKMNVLAMQWKDVNLSRQVWHIKDTKNGEPLAVPLMPEAIEILSARKPKVAAKYVFGGAGKYGYMKDPRKGWQRLLDRDELEQLAQRINQAGGDFEWPMTKVKGPKDHTTKVETMKESLARARAVAADMAIDTDGARLSDLRIHDLRRTLGSWQARHGASLVIIGKSLGHKDLASTAIYSRLNLDPVRDSMMTATRAMFAAGGLLQKAEVTHISKAKTRKKAV